MEKEKDKEKNRDKNKEKGKAKDRDTDKGQNPEISLIIPVYNKEKELQRCLESVRRQSYPAFEVILVDDGSTDGSYDICRSYQEKDSRFRLFHKKNGGLSRARNFGIEQAGGRYLAFTDADDWLHEDYLKRLHELIECCDADIASVSYVLAGDGTVIRKRKHYPVKRFGRKEALRYYLYTGLSRKVQDYPVWIKLYRRELFDTIRFPEGALYEDMLINTKLLLNCCTYVKIEEPLYYYYQGDGSIIRAGLKKRDFDFYKTNDEIYRLIRALEDRELTRLAKAVRARSPMSLLLKACVYGIDGSIETPRQTLRKLQRDLRRQLVILLRSPLPFSRKLASLVLSICPPELMYGKCGRKESKR